ncbi:unnamed protein product [Mycena citricolor]|uniref:Beta-mannosidase B n=1 Tax=Mycena citricolor TaxID=2018698 RepID=A0AAD2K3G5_9AGAR|nr:unnamed protein product [Mycena citricolor]
MDGRLGYAAWRWLFFIEGSLTVAVAVAAMFILPDFPENSSDWLSPAEQALAEKRMTEDAYEGASILKGPVTQGLSMAVRDWKVWWLAGTMASIVTSLSFNAYFPTLAETMGYGNTVTLLLCAPPWFFATAVSFLVSRHSDQAGERFWHVVGPLLLGILGFLLAMSTMNTLLRYISLFLMAQSYAGHIVFLSWISGCMRPASKRAVALALTNVVASFGNIGGSSGRFSNNFFNQGWTKFKQPGLVDDDLTCLLTMTDRVLEDWSFTQIGGGQGTKDGEWSQVSQFPTTVHVELLKLGRIPDPFVALHEWDVQWVGESRWAFRSSFTVSDKELAVAHTDLLFEGLDTYARILLNGTEIGTTNNQFVASRFDVQSLLKTGSNELLLEFDSAFTRGKQAEKEHGALNLWNGDSSRLHVRKAQYNYGWDWGPVLMTTGPWKPIRLQAYTSRISDIDIRADVSEGLDVTLSAKFSFEKLDGFASFTFKNPDGSIQVSSTKMPTAEGSASVSFSFKPDQLQLWYPVGYGEQALYSAVVEITDSQGNILDTQTQNVGIRRVRIVQEPLADQEGLTFLFEVNNIRIFCGGSNWIPADSFLTTVTAERYRAWLQLLVDGNQNMVRVWGGGIYEADAFYEICDELGILVWQDFMFGCGQYPAYQSFLDSVQEEAEQNVKRLRKHPSIVIFAGNNEDYQIAESLNLELDYADEKSDYLKTNFPARHIYERLLPDVVGRLSDVFYHRGSPYSGQGKPTTDKAYGDLHQWNVWHGTQEPWHKWDTLAGRFVEAYPNMRTVDYWLDGKVSERYPQSRTNTQHNKADGFERRLELYLVENFKHSFDMESYCYYTQVMQAETLASAYRLWRRNWAGKGRQYTAGALVWQINDCWPVTSWAIVDYFLRPKPSYFTIARELRPFTVGIKRMEVKKSLDDLSAAQFTIRSLIEIWGTNSTLAEKKAVLEVTCFDLDSDGWRDQWKKEVLLQPNSSTELFQGDLPGQPERTKYSQTPKPIVVSARLLDDQGVVLGRYSNWPEPFKFINFPADTSISVAAHGETITLSTNRPVKGLVLEVDGPDVTWSDQALDLVPDDPQTIRAAGLDGRKIHLRYLGDGTA